MCWTSELLWLERLYACLTCIVFSVFSWESGSFFRWYSIIFVGYSMWKRQLVVTFHCKFAGRGYIAQCYQRL